MGPLNRISVHHLHLSSGTVRCVCLRVPSIGVADRLADPQGEQSLVAGVGQGVDGLREHAGRSGVDPSQEFEEEVQPISADKQNEEKIHEPAV